MAAIPPMPTPLLRQGPGALAEALVRRARLHWWRPPVAAHAPPMGLLLGEVGEAIRIRLWQPRPLAVAPAAHPRVVILLPGFATHPHRLRYMAHQLEAAGHIVKRWGAGFNLGPSRELFDRLSQRVRCISAQYGSKVWLVGWSLGGVFARELAKHDPDCVAKVVTMGSPFSHTPYSNNLWRFYQLVTGLAPGQSPVPADLSAKPPVETVALWSPRDGLVSPRAARGRPGERDREVALRCTHIGFCHSPEAINAVLSELA